MFLYQSSILCNKTVDLKQRLISATKIKSKAMKDKKLNRKFLDYGRTSAVNFLGALLKHILRLNYRLSSLINE